MATVNLSGNLRVNWHEGGIDIANNKSTLYIDSVELYLTDGGGAYLNGTTYINGAGVGGVSWDTATVSMDSYWDYIKVVATGGAGGTGAATITHNADGTATATISADYSYSNYSWCDGNVSGSATVTLSTIPRASALNAYDGTLGVAQTISATTKASGFTHTLTWACGSKSGTIASNSSDTSWSFTPPISLASQNTTGSSVSITYTLTTIKNGAEIGTDSKTVTASIPASVKPSVSLSVTDPGSHLAVYGKYIQHFCTLSITGNAYGSQGSTISAVEVTADGNVYKPGLDSNSAYVVSTGQISGSGTLTIKVKVTDSRNRTAEATQNIAVYAYNAPTISINSYRADANTGSKDEQGLIVIASASGSYTSLEGKNSKTLKLRYRVRGGSWSGYTTVTDNQTIMFDAAAINTYEVEASITDNFQTITNHDYIPTVYATVDMRNGGKGVAVGGMSTRDGLDVYMNAAFHNGMSIRVSDDEVLTLEQYIRRVMGS